MKHLIHVCSALLILLYTYTGLTKLADLDQFRITLSKSPLLGGTSALLALPVIELFVAGTLIFPVTRFYGLWFSLVLLVALTGYLAYMVSFVPLLPCSCGGVLQSLTWPQHILFNGCFLLLNVFAIILHHKSTNMNRSPPAV